jgi:ubiquinone/menaquinone biosynthesis C-methylase UbiE
MTSLSFDSMAEVYDETRVFNKDCFSSVLDYLQERFPPDRYNSILEPGVGTGRIAVPLAERGYKVTGVDISGRMLAVLQGKLAGSGQSLQILFRKADVLKLPFPDEAFSMAVVVHLFHQIEEWKRAVNEVFRVLGLDAPLVLMQTGVGAEIPFLNDRYMELCAEQGFPVEYVGVKSTRELVGYCESLGCSAEWIRNRWQWTAHNKIDRALNYMKSRAFSFTTFASEEIHLRAIGRLESELKSQFDSLDTKVDIPNQIYLVVVTRPC